MITLGRPSRTRTRVSIGDEVWTAVNYDHYGRVFQQFDAAPAGHNAIQHQYNAYGYLSRVIDAATHKPYYTVIDTDNFGNVTETLSGNGVTTYRHYDPLTGRLNTIQSGLLGTLIGNVQDLAYEWDDLGNLDWRREYSGGKSLEERFEYDNLNRLTRSQVIGGNRIDISYNSRGNITHKNTYSHLGARLPSLSPGTYTYGNRSTGGCSSQAGPHAVVYTTDGACYQYDHNGNMTNDGQGRSLQYTSYDMVSRISRLGHVNEFKYGPDRTRFERKDTDPHGKVTFTHYLGSVERITHQNGHVVYKRQLPGGVLVEVEQEPDGLISKQIRYLHTDHLGSVDVITDQWGNIVQELSFDAWGLRRNAINWNDATLNQLVANLPLTHVGQITTRGYTGHEMLDDVGLIHMNGRIYDPRLGRFLQADPFIQSPSNTQSYNRYSYVLNNPMAYTDPSGYFFKKIWNEIRPFVGAIAAIALNFFAPGLGFAMIGMLSGALNAAANGANLGGVIQGAVMGAFSGASGGSWLAHGIVGGVSSVLGGGRFGHGFVAAGIGYATGGVGGIQGFILSSLGGGAASKLTGGKFRNGAATAAFTWALSQGAQRAFSGCADTSVLDGPVGEGVSLYDGKISVHAAGEDAVLTDDQLSTVKSDLGLIFERGGDEGQRLYNALDSDKPLKIIVNSQGSNAAYLKGNVLSIDLSFQVTLIDQNTMEPFVASTTRILTHEMGHALLGLHDIHPVLPWIQIGDVKYQNSPNVRFTDRVMKNIHGDDAHRRRYY